MVVPDFGTYREHVAQLVRPAERVAGVGRPEACSLALLVSPPLVSQREEVSPIECVCRVVDDAVGLAEPRDIRADAAASAEGSDGTAARRTAHHGVALPHEVRFRLRVDG